MNTLYKFISYALHPLMFSFIGTFLYLVLTPVPLVPKQEYIILIIVFVTTYILPIFLLMFLKKVDMISSFHLVDIDERKFPVLFFILLSLLLGKFLLKISFVNLLAYSFFGTSTALAFTYLLLFLRTKTSLHTLGIGGILGFVLVMSMHYQLNYIWLIALLFLVSGLLAVARLKLNAHTPKEVYFGFILGIASQLASFKVFLYNM